jgi:hypothetical protein
VQRGIRLWQRVSAQLAAGPGDQTAKYLSSAVPFDLLRPLYTIDNLARSVHRLIEIPKLVVSDRKADRRYAEHVLNEVLRPRFAAFHKDKVDAPEDRDSDPKALFDEYLILLENRKVAQAEQHARSWYRALSNSRP